MTRTVDIALEDTDTDGGDLGIAGLRFAPNRILGVGSEGASQTKVISNGGSIVGHFVSWPEGVDRTPLSLHAGRTDQLTFASPEPRSIVGHFVDCRARSVSRGQRVVLRFASALDRKLIVPAGVAHAFEGIGGAIVRNDLELVCSPLRQADLDDTRTFPLDTPPDALPAVEVGGYPMPSPAAIAYFQMRRDELRGPAPESDAPGIVRFEPNAAFPVEGGGCGLVPTTSSCVMDLVLIDGAFPEDLVVHTRHDVLHTFLDRAGQTIGIEVVDLRASSPRFGESELVPFCCDPRFHVRIPAGVAYRYRTPSVHALRIEYELFVDAREPRADLCPIGGDLRVVRPGDPTTRQGVRPPEIPAPPEVLRMLMRKELELLGTWTR